MKKFSKKIVSILLSLMLIVTASIVPSMTAQAASSKAKMITLNTSKTTKKYDVTGDKKADKIKFVCSNSKDYSSDWYDTLKVYINNKLAYSNKNCYLYSVQEVKSKIIKLKNGKVFMLLQTIGMNDDNYPINGIYQYKKGKLKCVVNLSKPLNKYSYHLNCGVTKVEGNTIHVKYELMCYSLGSSQIVNKYTYKDGQFKLNSSGTIKYATTMNSKTYEWKKTKTLTTAKKLSVYKKPTSKKATAKIPKNKKVKLSTCKYVDGKMFIKLKYGKKTYWLKASKGGSSDPFKNLAFGG